MVERKRRRIDRILDSAYLEGIAELPLDELRGRRAESEEEEAVLSYERRLLHARMDIMRGELERRAGSSGESLVELLPKILGGEGGASRGAFPRDMTVPSFEESRRRVERMVSDDTLANLPGLSEEQINEILRALGDAERDVSEQRRAILGVVDALTDEVGRRYRSGEADPTDLLTHDR